MEISIIRFCIGLLLVAVPLYVLHVFDTGLLRRALRALGQMVGSLVALGLCLYFVFRLDHWAVNVLSVLLMLVVGAVSTTVRAGLNVRRFIVPVGVGMLTAAVLVGLWVVVLALGQVNAVQARFLVPVM